MYKVLFVSLFLLAIQDTIILNPLGDFNPRTSNKLLIYNQGAYVPNDKYVPLMKIIQAKLKNNLPKGEQFWICLTHFTRNLPNPMEMNGQVDFCLKKTNEMIQSRQGIEVKPHDTFIGGHSLGGALSGNAAITHKFAGVLLHASFLLTDLVEFPIPVIYVDAELDGLTTVPKVAFEFEKFEQFVSREGLESAIKRKSVIILHDINHSQYANISTLAGDILPEKSLEYAFENIAEVSSSFFTIQLTNSPSHFNKLRDLVIQTRNLVKGFLFTYRKIELGGEWCRKSQQVFIDSVSTPYNFNVSNVEYSSIAPFTLSKPSLEFISREQKRVRSITTTYNLYVSGVPTLPLTSVNMACKMKNQEAILSFLNISKPFEKINCSNINQLSFEFATKQLEPRTFEKYLKRGLQFQFDQDVQYSSGLTWVPSLLSINYIPKENPTKISIASASLFTTMRSFPGFEGMQYCKLISPARIQELIFTDVLIYSKKNSL